MVATYGAGNEGCREMDDRWSAQLSKDGKSFCLCVGRGLAPAGIKRHGQQITALNGIYSEAMALFTGDIDFIVFVNL